MTKADFHEISNISNVIKKRLCCEIDWGGGAFRKIRGLGRKTNDSFSCDDWESDILVDGFKGLYDELVIPCCKGIIGSVAPTATFPYTIMVSCVDSALYLDE